MDDCGLKGNSSWRDKSVCHDVLVKKLNGILILENMTMLFNDPWKKAQRKVQKKEKEIKRKIKEERMQKRKREKKENDKITDYL